MHKLILNIALLIPTMAVAQSDRPNIIIVMTDDQGLGDFSITGNPRLKTPNLDKFARESVRLTDFHVAPMCTPTRGQLLTGLDALRNGATSVTAGRTFIRQGIPTLPELLSNAGYKTGLFGKWHLGDHYPHRPIDRGFQIAVWHKGWGMLQSTQEFGNPLIDGHAIHGTIEKPFEGHCTDYWFEQATQWMQAKHDAKEPFFCYIPTNAPHTPHIELTQYTKPYNDLKPGDFFGMIAHIDDRFGQLDRFLKTTGLADNTLVIFLTDNGGTAGWQFFNAGLRGHKTEYYEGGHRVPCWIRWPAGKIGPPRAIEVPTQAQDLMPTILNLCNIEAPNNLDGHSLAGLLLNPQAELPDRKLVVQYSRDKVAKNDACIIWKNWRLVHGKELYNVEADLAQKDNLAEQHPEIVTAMQDHYETWWQIIEPKVNDYVAISIGSPKQKVVELTSADWEGVYADNTGHVRSAVGGPTGGHWNIFVETPGRYRFTLRRWPEYADTPLSGKFQAEGMLLKADRKLGRDKLNATFPIKAAQVRVAETSSSTNVSPDATKAVMELQLPKGRTQLQAWFKDGAGNNLCGAFFVDVEKLPREE